MIRMIAEAVMLIKYVVVRIHFFSPTFSIPLTPFQNIIFYISCPLTVQVQTHMTQAIVDAPDLVFLPDQN